MRITSAKQQTAALEERLRELHSTSSDSIDAKDEGAPDTGQQAAHRRVALAAEYCRARLSRLQAARDALDGGRGAAAEATGSVLKAEL